MSRRRSNTLNISLFSFQDIITSVSGIMILIVLLLSLELTSRKSKTENESNFEEVATNIQKGIQEIQQKIESLNYEIDETSEKLETAGNNPVSVLNRAITANENNIQEKNHELTELQITTDKLNKSKSEITAKLNKLKDNSVEMNENKKEIQNKKELIDQIKNKKCLNYVVPEGIDDKNAFICDIHHNYYNIIPFMTDMAGKTTYKIDTISMDNSDDIFSDINNILNNKYHPRYVLFIIRPGSASIGALLRHKSLVFEYGIDVISEDYEILNN